MNEEDVPDGVYAADESYVDRMDPRRRLGGRAAGQNALETLRRYCERERERERERGDRTPSRGSARGSPNSVASSSASPDAVLRSRALPVSPPPAQPDLLPRPVYEDVGVVGVLEAPQSMW